MFKRVQQSITNRQYLRDKKKREKRYWARMKAYDTLFSDSRRFVMHDLGSGLSLYLHPDSEIERLIYAGYFELHEIAFTKSYLKAGDVFLDVGANVGLFSLYAAQAVGEAGKVHSFEPVAKTLKRFKANISLNNFDEKIIAHKIGVSKAAEELEIVVSIDGYDAWNSFGSPTKGEKFSTEKVPTLPLDQVYNQLLPVKEAKAVTLIKIDVEGWEYPVLEGGTSWLSAPDAPVLMVEFNDENAAGAGFKSKDIFELGKSYGYQWYRYNSTKNQFQEELGEYDSFPYMNLIATKDLQALQTRLAH